MDYDAAGNMTRQTDFAKNLTKNMTYYSSNRTSEVRGSLNRPIGRYFYDDQGFRV